MGRRLWAVIAALVIAVAALWVLYAVWRSPQRIGLATYGAFAVAVVVMALGWIAWVWRSAAREAGSGEENREIDYFVDLLAKAVGQQWAQAADERGLLSPEPIPVRWGKPVLPLAGPAAAAMASRRFDPLPGLSRAGQEQLSGGQIGDLHALYGGLGSGRLLIAGGAGSGKSGAAVLLILAALKYREQVAGEDRRAVPVPVLFTVRDWNPVSQRVGDWMAGQMRQTYPLFAGKTGLARAAALVDAGKIALVLDGLDEIAEDLRPIALRALSRQATFRVVVLSRTAEMASAASRRGVLEGAGAVQLRSLDPDDAADYLSSVQLDPPPDGWRDLINRIRSEEDPIARSLNSPLTVTLVRDTYRAGDDVRELLAFCDDAQVRLSGAALAEEITGHLLDRVLPVAYARQPGEAESPYDLRTARHALTKIAVRMNQDRTRDLQWWRFPKWAPRLPRILITELVVGLMIGLATGLVSAISIGLVGGVEVGAVVVFALSIGFTVSYMAGPGRQLDNFPPRSMGKLKHGLRRAVAPDNLGISIPVGLITGLVSGLLHFWPGGLLGGLASGLAFGIWAALLGGLLDAAWYPDSASALTPRGSWRNDMKFALVVGLMSGLMLGFLAGFKVGPAAGLGTSLAVIPLLGLTSSAALWSSIAAGQLARRWHTPVRLMRFLDDAHTRGVLRTVGPVYQFRHASLQDRLATKAGSPPLPQDRLAAPPQADLLSTWISFAPDPETSAAYLADHTHDLTDPQAIALLRDECYSQPGDGLMWRHLGLLLLADQSADAYDAAGTGHPSPLQRAAAMLDNDDLDHALGWACLARAADPGPGALLMGQVHARRGEVNQAAEALDTAAEYLSPERLSEVLAVYDHLLALQPDQPWLHAGRAEALRSAGQLEDALAAYDRAISLAPDDPSLHFNRGNLLFSMSRFEDAQDELLTVTQLRPGDILGPAVLLAAIAWPAERNQARQHLQAALSSPGERLSPFTRAFFRAIALVGLGQASKAVTELKEAKSARTPQEARPDDEDRIIFARFSDPPLPGLELIQQLIEPGPDGIQSPEESGESGRLQVAVPINLSGIKPDNGGFTHLVLKGSVAQAISDRQPVTAVCGWTWIPQRSEQTGDDLSTIPVCPACEQKSAK